jgi:steroid 5-alpha reductase family enzyme
MQTSVFMWSALVILAAVLVVWAISVKIKDASIVDVFWGFGFVLVAWVARLVAGGDWTLRRTLLLVAATAWGLRLTWHLGRRNLGKGEDFRYRAMRKKHGDKFWLVSLRTVFLFQGLMIFIVSLPLQVGLMRHDDRSEITALVLAGFVVWCIGVGFETLGDLQLKRFKANPANKGTILATGLWAWTRHPNYFGDSVAWWGMWLIAASVLPGIPTIVAPIVMTILLRRVSGVPMLEYTMRKRPGYDAYIAQTSPFVPRPPKRA